MANADSESLLLSYYLVIPARILRVRWMSCLRQFWKCLQCCVKIYISRRGSLSFMDCLEGFILRPMSY